jgi:hypothetical protein
MTTTTAARSISSEPVIGRAGRGVPGFLKKMTIVIALGSAVALGSAAPAAAATPTTSVTAVAFTAPTPAAAMVGGIWRNTSVTMRCWVDNAWSNWPYRTNRWFLVEGLGYNPYSGRPMWVRGYVSANTVVNQVRVGHC